MIVVNNCNVCVFYFCIVSNKLDLFEATHFIIMNLLTMPDRYKLKTVPSKIRLG